MKLIQASKQDKKNQIERLLQHGTVMFYIDTRVSGVSVPSHFMDNSQLALNFDYAYRIPDFKVLDDRVEATLEFGPLYFFCILPMNSIYTLRSDLQGEMVVFPEDMPQDLFNEQKPAIEPEKPKLTSVHITEASTEAPPVSEPTPRKKGHLKLVE